MIKSFLNVTFATALMGLVAYGQTSTSSTTLATQPNGVTETKTTESTGTVTEVIPGRALFVKAEADQPLRYKFGKNVSYVTSDGKVIEASQVKRDSSVRVHYIKDGDDMVVDKVIVMRNIY